MFTMATLTNSGRAAMALAVSQRPLHLAWGTGDPAWDDDNADLPSLVEREALVHEIGRRVPASIGFVVLDETNGDIVVPTGVKPDGTVIEARYRQVAGPTPHLYIRTNYDYGDASNATIREIAVYMDTVTKAGLPPGQRYFLPADLESPGLMLAAQIIKPCINRSPATRHSLEFVLPI